jgi:actin-related protein 8
VLQGFFKPEVFDYEGKLDGRRSLLERSFDLYDSSPNDPTSVAQGRVLEYAANHYPTCKSQALPSSQPASTSTPGKFLTAPPSFNILSRLNVDEKTPRSSIAGSPAPEGTPKADRGGSPAAGEEGTGNANGPSDPVGDRIRQAEERDRVLPVMPLDEAIILSVREGARGDERKMRDFLGGVMVVGGGAKMPGFNAFLEVKLREQLPGFTKEILVGMPPRELDQQLVVWKGGSVFARLSSSGNDSWVYQKEYELLGTKLLMQKLMFAY